MLRVLFSSYFTYSLPKCRKFLKADVRMNRINSPAARYIYGNTSVLPETETLLFMFSTDGLTNVYKGLQFVFVQQTLLTLLTFLITISISNGSNWLHKQVTVSKNRFAKCNLQKSSCLKLQGPQLLYLVYSIIQRSSTKVVKIMPVGSKLTPPRGSQFYIELYKEKFKRHLLNRLW